MSAWFLDNELSTCSLEGSMCLEVPFLRVTMNILEVHVHNVRDFKKKF